MMEQWNDVTDAGMMGVVVVLLIMLLLLFC
jgi:hypothetical protein